MQDVENLKYLVDYGVIALLIIMSFVAVFFFIERVLFYRKIDVNGQNLVQPQFSIHQKKTIFYQIMKTRLFSVVTLIYSCYTLIVSCLCSWHQNLIN